MSNEICFRRHPEKDVGKFADLARTITENGYVPYIAGCTTLVAFCIVSLATFTTRQSIRSIELVGRSRAIITTFGLVRPSRFTVPLENINALRARSSGAASYIPLKITGYRLFFLIDQSNGHFHKPNLYDTTVGLWRD